MAKTSFNRGQRVPKEWFNAMQDIQFDGQDLDGHYDPLTDAALSNASGNIKSEFYGLRDAGRVTAATGLNVTVAACTVGLQNGTRVSIAQTDLTATNGATRIVFIDNNGALQIAASAPNDGVLLARVVASGGTVTTITDLRERTNFQVRPIVVPAAPTFIMPSGTIVEFAGSSAPSGWLICDGSEVSRTLYADLFAAIGTAYGTPSSGSVFKLPDHRNRVGRGVGAGTSLGATGGADNVTLATNQMPSHNHGLTVSAHSHSVSDPGHGHSYSDPGHTHQLYTYNGANGQPGTDGFGTAGQVAGIAGEIAGNGAANAYTTVSATGQQLVANAGVGISIQGAGTNVSVNAATVPISMANTGGSTPVDVRNQFLGVNFIIKT